MFGRSGSIKLATLFGFRIGVDRSWFVVLFLMIFWLSGAFRNALHHPDSVAYLTTVVTVLVLFGSLIVHELGEASRWSLAVEGIEVQRIDLFLFGGLTPVNREHRHPGRRLPDRRRRPAGDVRRSCWCAWSSIWRSSDLTGWCMPPRWTARLGSHRCCCR